jgi:hypothetical protein
MIDSQWRKSSASNSSSNCVEVRGRGETVDVRDSKNVPGPVLTVCDQAWSEFIDGIKLGGFDI